jgi:hypothetical protein
MEERPDPRIIKSDRLDNAIVVALDDGNTTCIQPPSCTPHSRKRGC